MKNHEYMKALTTLTLIGLVIATIGIATANNYLEGEIAGDGNIYEATPIITPINVTPVPIDHDYPRKNEPETIINKGKGGKTPTGNIGLVTIVSTGTASPWKPCVYTRNNDYSWIISVNDDYDVTKYFC
jgi:hypothetical protein